MKASITLEGSIIYPITITTICILILYSFSMHDRLSTKATAYTSLIQQYHKDDNDISDDFLQEDIDAVCLLSDSSSIHDLSSNRVVIKHRLGKIIVSFTNYERCQFIRNIETIIKPFQ